MTRCAGAPPPAHALGEETPRALVLGMLVSQRGMGVEEISELFNGQNHAPAAVDRVRVAGLAAFDLNARARLGARRRAGLALALLSWPGSATMRSPKGRRWRAGRRPISAPTG
jgi:hypothetical protein